MITGLNIIVGIATAGRREVLTKTIDLLSCQSRLPDRLLICPTSLSDVDEAALKRYPVPPFLLETAAGLTVQRNKILAALTSSDLIVFFDDDFFAHQTYLSNLEKLFLKYPDVVAATGRLIADGAQGPGIDISKGTELLRSAAPSDDDQPVDCYGTYGCNMAFRSDLIRTGNILFDENLPLYGWQEDIDFSRQFAPYGRIVTTNSLVGVHLGIKLGRTSGVRFGYSQIANPLYLIKKGTLSFRRARNLISRNIAANVIRSLYPEPWIDRRGRLKGNFLALKDHFIGRGSPLSILHLD